MSSQDLPGFGERVPLEAGGGTRSSLARERGGKEIDRERESAKTLSFPRTDSFTGSEYSQSWREWWCS